MTDHEHQFFRRLTLRARRRLRANRQKEAAATESARRWQEMGAERRQLVPPMPARLAELAFRGTVASDDGCEVVAMVEWLVAHWRDLLPSLRGAVQTYLERQFVRDNRERPRREAGKDPLTPWRLPLGEADLRGQWERVRGLWLVESESPNAQDQVARTPGGATGTRAPEGLPASPG